MTEWTGTWRLVRHALRRDRVVLPVWITSVTGLSAAVVAAEVAMYATAAEREIGAAFGAENVFARIMDGPASGTTLGAISMVESMVTLAIFVALMSAQAVVRHTRQDEETGRAELIGSGIVGRQARLTAALVVSVGASVVVGAGVALALLVYGLPLEGSLASGAALAGVGVCFAAIAGVAAQVSTTQRGANGIAGAALGVAFLLRAVGDAAGTVAPSGVELISAWPSWLSPLGWAQQMRAFHQDNWEVLSLFGVLFVGLVAAAYALANRRDMGAGLLAARRGPVSASQRLLSPWGLAFRLQRWPLVAWGAALVITGVSFGSMGQTMEQFADDNPRFADFLLRIAPGASISELYFALIFSFIAVAASGYTLQALLRMRAEEASGRLEPILSTAVGRKEWLASHGRIAAGGSVALMVACGGVAAVSNGVASGDYGAGWGVVSAAVVQIPAILALGGFVFAVFGLAPRWAGALSWAALAGSFVVGQFGELLELPQAVVNLSPFTHVPAVPAESLAVVPIVVLLAIAGAFVGIGVRGFRRRDLAIAA
jgi:ABC-2 type transport system permease protein